MGRCIWVTYHVTAAYARDLNPPWPHGWTVILYFCTATGFIRISPPWCTVRAQECPWLCPRAGGRACLFVCFPRPGHGPLATRGWSWKGPLSGGVHEPQADPGRGVSLGAIPAAKSWGCVSCWLGKSGKEEMPAGPASQLPQAPSLTQHPYYLSIHWTFCPCPPTSDVALSPPCGVPTSSLFSCQSAYIY